MLRPQDPHIELFLSLGKSVQSVGSLETYNGQSCVACTNLTPTGFNSLGESLKFAAHQNGEIAQHTDKMIKNKMGRVTLRLGRMQNGPQ